VKGRCGGWGGSGREGEEGKRLSPLCLCAEELLGLLTSFGYCSAWGI